MNENLKSKSFKVVYWIIDKRLNNFDNQPYMENKAIEPVLHFPILLLY